jgi:GNAT superfamily N-acetyltransferase
MAPSDPITVRLAISRDVPSLFELILALADYERLADQVVGSPAALYAHLFEQRCIEALVAESDQQIIGFALFFVSYASALTQPGFYLEDLFVQPDYRGRSLGKMLLSELAKLAVERQYSRLEWSVLDWNAPAIGFYRRIGATIAEDVRVCRVDGSGLGQLAAQLERQIPPVQLRQANPADLPHVFELVRDNVAHDGGLERFTGTAAALGEHLFEQAYVEAVVAEREGNIVGLALVYKTYSTFLTQPGLFIEDLYVQPDFRSQGIGTVLLAYLAQQVLKRDYGRLEWRVRTWNQQAIGFYQRLGAKILPDWLVCQMNSEAVVGL